MKAKSNDPFSPLSNVFSKVSVAGARTNSIYKKNQLNI